MHYTRPFNTLLIKEVQRYNVLINTIQSSMQGVLSSLEGMRKMDSEIESTVSQLKVGKTPDEWLMKSYPGYNTLALYVDNLGERVAYINELLVEAQEEDSESEGD